MLNFKTSSCYLLALHDSPGWRLNFTLSLKQSLCHTGIYSGSIHKDLLMKTTEFKYKQVYDGTVTPIKTHHPADTPLGDDRDFDKAILMLRDPFQTIKANYNRKKAGKCGIVSATKFKKTGEGFYIVMIYYI